MADTSTEGSWAGSPAPLPEKAEYISWYREVEIICLLLVGACCCVCSVAMHHSETVADTTRRVPGGRTVLDGVDEVVGAASFAGKMGLEAGVRGSVKLKDVGWKVADGMNRSGDESPRDKRQREIFERSCDSENEKKVEGEQGTCARILAETCYAMSDAWYELPLPWLLIWLAGLALVGILSFTVLVWLPGAFAPPALLWTVLVLKINNIEYDDSDSEDEIDDYTDFKSPVFEGFDEPDETLTTE
jgi:hypothetical protein